ncbi:MAG: hypothetical protein AAGH71_02710 [Planctomycetota bacterium]
MAGGDESPFEGLVVAGHGSVSSACKKLSPSSRTVVVNGKLSGREYRKLASTMKELPGVGLRLIDYEEHSNLSFLKHFTGIQTLGVIMLGVESFDPIAQLGGSLRVLSLARTYRRSHSIRCLESLPNLRALSIDGHSKSFEVVEGLTKLESLRVRSLRLEDATPLSRLADLRQLSVGFGSLHDLSPVGTLKDVETLEIGGNRNLTDLDWIQHLGKLKHLSLYWLSAVERLPSLRPLASLDRVAIVRMKRLESLESIADSQSIRMLLLESLPFRSPEAYRCLAAMPALQSLIVVGLGIKARAEILRAAGCSNHGFEPIPWLGDRSDGL